MARITAADIEDLFSTYFPHSRSSSEEEHEQPQVSIDMKSIITQLNNAIKQQRFDDAVQLSVVLSNVTAAYERL